MKSMPERYTITIFGNSYTIVSDEEPEVVMKLLRDVETAMGTMAAKIESNDGQKVAVLTALQFAYRLREAEIALRKKEQQELKIIDCIDQQLSSLIVS